jgi:hypothetical protein
MQREKKRKENSKYQTLTLESNKISKQAHKRIILVIMQKAEGSITDAQRIEENAVKNAKCRCLGSRERRGEEGRNR